MSEGGCPGVAARNLGDRACVNWSVELRSEGSGFPSNWWIHIMSSQHAQIHPCIYVYMHVYIYIHVYIYVYMYICIYLHMCICIYVMYV